MPSLGEVVDLLHGWYPPHLAASWDASGLVAGDPADNVRRVLFAVDPVAAVADEAVAWDADLLVTHHPLFLTAVHGVPATDPKGRVLHRLVRSGCGLLTAHTNADHTAGGVTESLSLALGLTGLAPLVPAASAPMDKLTVYVPREDAEALREALAGAGAGQIGDYDHASFASRGEGRFRPLAGAHPTIGEIGRVEVVDEVRI